MNPDHINGHEYCILKRAEPALKEIVESDARIKNTTLGLCNYLPNDTIVLYLVPERLKNPFSFRTTTIHEIGHALGMKHLGKPSVMHQYNHNDVLYPTYKDAIELGKLYGIDPKNLRYFKL